jgi:hypothetical protein
MDSLYLQLFQALFPQFNFEDIEPGKTEEEMAENIDQLIKLLETNILEHDLSDIKAEAIVTGDLAHIDEFLQVLLQVVFLMIQNQAEGEESEEELESAQKQRNDKSSSKKHKSDERHNDKFSDDHSDDMNQDETDTQKMAKDMGLNSPDMEENDSKKGIQELYDMDDGVEEKDQRLLHDLEQEYEDQLVKEGLMDPGAEPNSRKKSDKAHGRHDDMEDEEPRFSDLDFYGKNPPDHKQVMVDDDDEDPEAQMLKQARKKQEEKETPGSNKRQSDNKKQGNDRSSGKKQAVDVLNDPLLPEGVDFGSKKNKARADSLGGGGSFKGNDLLDEQEDDDDLLVIDNLDELDEEQKYMVLQHLFEEYQKDPDSFPDDQKELLEHEMMKLYQKAEMDGDLEDEGDFEEDDLRMAPSSGKKHKGYSDDKKDKRQWVDDDSDNYDNDPMFQGSDKKAKPRPLHDDEDEDEDDSQDERMHMAGELNMPNDKMPNRHEDSDVEDHEVQQNPQHHDEDEDEDEKYMKEIIQQQNQAQADREEQQQELEQDDHDGMDEGEDMPEHEDNDDAAQPIEITEEEFKNLPPEEQQRMLMLMQQQQMEAEGEEGEGEEEVPEVDQEYLNALQLQMMQQEQLAQMQRMKKKGKKPKKKRPSTAKYGWNSRSTKLQSRSMRRPGTAKKRKSKSKAKQRRIAEQQYLQQMQQQQMMQQMAYQQQLEQQQQQEQNQNQNQVQEIDEEQLALLQENIANIQPVDENGEPIEMTPEELAEFQNNLLQQQLQQNQQMEGEGEGGDGDEELEQYTPEQIAMLQQQAYEQQLREQSMLRRKKGKKRSSSKRRASRKKTKKPKRKKQQMDEQTAFLMMLQQNPELQQQFIQQQQMQAMGEDQMQPDQMYNVEKIDEEENEESPMKSQQYDGKNHERPTEESNHTADEIVQQNQLQPGETDDEGIYEDEENQQMLANLSPEELAYLQQKAAQEQQMMGYPQEEKGQYYSPHQGNSRGLYDQQNMVQQNIINQNEALNKMFKNYIADMKRKEAKKNKRRVKKQLNRRRSFAAAYGGRSGTNTAIPHKRALDLKSKIKRDVKQVVLAKKIYMLANEIERNRLLEEKRRTANLRKTTKTKKKSLKGTMRNRFQDQMALLKQSIESERMDRKIAKFVRTQAMAQWKRDLSRR